MAGETYFNGQYPHGSELLAIFDRHGNEYLTVAGVLHENDLDL